MKSKAPYCLHLRGRLAWIDHNSTHSLAYVRSPDRTRRVRSYLAQVLPSIKKTMLRHVFYKYVSAAHVSSGMLTVRPNTSAIVSPFISTMGFKTGVINYEQQKASTPPGMNLTISSIKRKFPNVKTVDTNTLAQWMSGDNIGKDTNNSKMSRNLVLVDVRPEEEAAVSMIPSAIRVDPEEMDMKKLQERIKEKSISKGHDEDAISVVMYCAVGYRASILVNRFQESLQKEGNQDAMHVYNLEGSIFKWANENRNMVTMAGEPTHYVHPYSTIFGKIYVDSSRTKFKP